MAANYGGSGQAQGETKRGTHGAHPMRASPIVVSAGAYQFREKSPVELPIQGTGACVRTPCPARDW
jgi:hypothetical protein